MGGSTTQTQQQNQAQSTTPWAPAAGTISSLLGQLGGISANPNATETGALNQLSALGGAGNPYAGSVGNVANSLLAGGGANNQAGLVNNAYSQYQQQLNPYLQSSFLDPRNTPGFSDALNAVNSDITNQVNGQFAAAGRDISGMNSAGARARFVARRRAARRQSIQSECPEPARRRQFSLRRRKCNRRPSLGIPAAGNGQSAGRHRRGGPGQPGAAIWTAPAIAGGGDPARHPVADACRADGHRAAGGPGISGRPLATRKARPRPRCRPCSRSSVAQSAAWDCSVASAA